MNTEAVMWLGLILASPAFFMCSKVFVIWFLGLFISDDVIELSIENENGEIVTKTISIDSDDELRKVLDSIQAISNNGNGVHS